MRTTIDQAGRVVIPKAVRDAVGMQPGEVDIVVDGPAVRIEPVAGDNVVERDGRLVIAGGDAPLTDDDVKRLRHADQR
jgi:AbrB family looped-hinge helix DNA binding protein